MVDGLQSGRREQVLMGVTGSGKTFTMANVIQAVQRPTLVLSHNKTLAAQLYCEFKEFFPHNAVSYFVSYYDYYQPEAYIPQRDIYIEKDASINEEIDRHAAGDDELAGEPARCDRRGERVVHLRPRFAGGLQGDDGRPVGRRCDRSRHDAGEAGRHSVRAERHRLRRGASFACAAIRSRFGRRYEEFAYRIEFWGDEIEQLSIINPTSGETIDKLEQIFIYPAKHFVLPEERIDGGGR